MYRIFLILLFLLPVLPSRAQGWYYSVNIDKKTTTAMVSAYGTQYAIEKGTEEQIKKILKHYVTAEVASAGIFASKWLDRKAVTNAGRFGDAQRNYYFKRIYNLVSKQIMPRIVRVAILSVKNPEKALYWGPYLFKVSEEVKQLCMQFEAIVCNGKISFKDIVFFSIQEQFKSLFDLSQLGDVDWESMLNNLGKFDKKLTKEDFMESLEGLISVGASIAMAGGNINLNVWDKFNGSGKDAISGKMNDITTAFFKFNDSYGQVNNPGTIKNTILQKLGTADSVGVLNNLFKVDDYDIGKYLTNYIEDAKGQYYKQTYYIQYVNAGNEILLDYKPSAYGKDQVNDKTKGGEYYYQSGSEQLPDFYEMCLLTSEKWTGWSRVRVHELNKSQPNHQYSIQEFIQSGYWYKNSDKNNIIGHYGAASIKVEHSWHLKDIVYEETFDSYKQDINVFLGMMNAKLQEFNENQTTEYDHEGNIIYVDAENPIVYELVAGPKRYYSTSDEKKMQGCESVNYTLHCHGESDLGEGSFQWKENRSHNHSNVREDTKKYAMETSLSSSPDIEQFDQIINEKVAEKNKLESEINSLTQRNKELLSLISSSSVNDAQIYREEYNSNQEKINTLQNELKTVNEQINTAKQSKEQMLEDYANETDTKERIPSVMHELEVAYSIDWNDAGAWEGNTFVRKGRMSGSDGYEVTFKGELSVVRGESHFWGMRIHRAIIKVHWTLSAVYESSQVIEVKNFDSGLSDAEKSEQANDRLHELQEEYPDCTVEMEYAYKEPNTVEDAPDEPHLLWISERLRIARNIEERLARINSHLILVEKFMMQKENILTYFKTKIFGGLPYGSKSRFGGKAFRRWQHAAKHINNGKKPEDIEILPDDKIEL